MFNYFLAVLVGMGITQLLGKGKTVRKKKTGLFARFQAVPAENLDALEKELGITKDGKPDLELQAFRVERINRKQREKLEK